MPPPSSGASSTIAAKWPTRRCIRWRISASLGHALRRGDRADGASGVPGVLHVVEGRRSRSSAAQGSTAGVRAPTALTRPHTPIQSDVCAEPILRHRIHRLVGEDLAALASRVADRADTISVDDGQYLKWAPPSGEQLWLQVKHNGDAMGMNPHFEGKSLVPVAVEARIARSAHTPLDGTFLAWANPPVGATPAATIRSPSTALTPPPTTR